MGTLQGNPSPSQEEGLQVDRIIQFIEARWAEKTTLDIPALQGKETSATQQEDQYEQEEQPSEPVQEGYRPKEGSNHRGLGRGVTGGPPTSRYNPVGRKVDKKEGSKKGSYGYQKTWERQIPVGGYIPPNHGPSAGRTERYRNTTCNWNKERRTDSREPRIEKGYQRTRKYGRGNPHREEQTYENKL